MQPERDHGAPHRLDDGVGERAGAVACAATRRRRRGRRPARRPTRTAGRGTGGGGTVSSSATLGPSSSTASANSRAYIPRSARRYGSSARNGESSPDGVGEREQLGASASRGGPTSTARGTAGAARRGGGRGPSRASRRVAARSTSAVTNGLPSRSPPIHEPIRTARVASTAIAPALGDEPLEVALQRRDDLEQAGAVVAQRLVDLVGDAQLRHAQHGRLPQREHEHAEVVVELGAVRRARIGVGAGGRARRATSPRTSSTVWRRTSVGWAVITGHDEQVVDEARGSGRPSTPAATRWSSVASTLPSCGPRAVARGGSGGAARGARPRPCWRAATASRTPGSGAAGRRSSGGAASRPARRAGCAPSRRASTARRRTASTSSNTSSPAWSRTTSPSSRPRRRMSSLRAASLPSSADVARAHADVRSRRVTGRDATTGPRVRWDRTCRAVAAPAARYSATRARWPSTSVGPALWVAIARWVAPRARQRSAWVAPAVGVAAGVLGLGLDGEAVHRAARLLARRVRMRVEHRAATRRSATPSGSAAVAEAGAALEHAPAPSRRTRSGSARAAAG